MCRDQTVMAHLLPTMTNVTHDPRDITDCVCVGCYHRSVRSTRCRPPIHAVSSHVATDKDPSEFWSIFSDNLQPIATRGKKARDTLLVDIGCSSKRAPLSVSYYNEISGGHIGSCRCSEEGLCRPSTAPVIATAVACQKNHRHGPSCKTVAP